MQIAETWDNIAFAQIIRGSMLITQSTLRKYILLPLLIIVKNIGRMLFLQFPEWSEDFKEWNREMHVKCTYNGVQLSETKKEEKDYRTRNQIIHESFSQIRSTNWTNHLLTKRKMKDLTDRTSTIRNQIEKIKKEKKKVTSEINISPNKTSYNAKRFESPKNICQILKRRNTRLIRKLHYFIKFFTEKIYIDIFLFLINIPRIKINIQLFLESTKKIIDKSIYNNKTNQNSQAYVFYKLSKTQVLNLYKTRKKLQNSEINQWKNWLRGHYQYDLSQIRWSQLIEQKWRNRINQCHKRDSYIYRSLFQKNPDRKYLDWKIFNFCLRKKINIEAWIKIDTNSNKNKIFFDWMGMNEEILSCPISNMELWFFPEFLLLYNAYKMKPWFIPSKLLFL
ncbi:hypothetical protein NMG60_11001145, partial [Bertholletia excelsa]